MNAPVLAEPKTASIAPAPAWRQVLLPLGVGLLLLGAIFNPEVAAAVRTWDASTAYNHCFLVIPIAAYLLWDRRDDLGGLRPRAFPAAALLGLPVAAVWLLAERLGIMEGRQLAAISFLELLFLGVLGRRLWWAMCGPLLYLYFLVPFGGFLTPQLQDVTTFFVRHGLDVLGVPAYIDGYTIEIPQGTFFVAQACAGLRFLIASMAFGSLYALLMYRSPLRRFLFILVSLIVPIFANGLRALGIVYLGYLLNSTQAAAADHIIYGWLFFSVVILILIALGLPFRQDHLPTGRGRRPSPATPPATPLGLLAAAVAVVVLAALAPALAAGLSAEGGRIAAAPAFIDMGPGCAVQRSAAAGPLHSERVTCGNGVPMQVVWQAFPPRSTAAPVMAARRRLTIRALTESAAAYWLHPNAAAPSAWRIMTSNEPVFVTAAAVWVHGLPTRPGLSMRAAMASDSLSGTSHAPMLVTVTPLVDWQAITPEARPRLEAVVQAFLLAHADLAGRIGALSAVP